MRFNFLPHLVVAAIPMGLAGCGVSATNFSIEVRNECVSQARSIQFTLQYRTAPTVSSNGALETMAFRVNGVAQSARVSPGGRVTLPLDGAFAHGMPLGAPVVVSGTISESFAALEVVDAAFYTEPPEGATGAAPCTRSALPALVAYSSINGRRVDWQLRAQHLSPEATDPITLDGLQWAGSTKALDDSKLVWGSTELEELSWTNVVPTKGQALAPGGTLTFDVPDSALAMYPVWLVRASSSGPTASERAIVQMVPNVAVTPVRGVTWGQIKARYR
jgi:hypothetical protein